MASTIAKTVVATGASSGLGFEAVKQLLTQKQPYRFILGARDTARTQAAFDATGYDTKTHSLTILPLELSDLGGVRTFASQTLEKLGGTTKLDVLFLNAAMIKPAVGPGPNGSRWCEPQIVNHVSQHYLIHLLREKLVADRSRVVVVSSGAVRNVPDVSQLEATLKADSGAQSAQVYSASKFTQLLGAHWWRRQLPECAVVAVSPGLIPGTQLSRNVLDFKLPTDHPDAKSVEEGASNLLRAFTRDDFPENPDQIFLTSWGEWWGPETIEKSLDKKLQDKWSPSKEEIEKEEGLL